MTCQVARKAAQGMGTATRNLPPTATQTGHVKLKISEPILHVNSAVNIV